MPTNGQVILVLCAALLFATGTAISLTRLLAEKPWQRLPPKVCWYFGLCAGLASLIWHAAGRGQWLPLGDNFDTMIWMALLLTGFTLYIQRRRPVGGLDWFLMPVAVFLLAAAAFLGRSNPHPYAETSWSWLHRITAYGGVLCFFVAGAAGGLYLINNARLRSKVSLDGPAQPSLERLERFVTASVSLGFALMTIGLVTGMIRILKTGSASGLSSHWLLAIFGWLVYALALHSPINPSFRGRKAAFLSLIGSLVMLGTIVAVLLTPGGAR